MDPTALPTDNLYKFAALSGIALVGLLIWLTWKVQRELQAALLTITTKHGISRLTLKYLEDMKKIHDLKVTQWKEKCSKLKAETATGPVAETDNTEEALTAEYKELEKDGTALNDKVYKLGKANAELEALVEGLQNRVQVFKRQKRQYIMATFVSLAWSLAGFGLWYYKLQMPLDAKLKLEAEVATIELQIKKAALVTSRPAESP